MVMEARSVHGRDSRRARASHVAMAVLWCVLAFGCAGVREETHRPGDTSAVAAAHAAEGEAVAAAMQARFDQVKDTDPLNAPCDGRRSPVFLCTGIMLRGTSAFSENYHAWNPNPSSPKAGGVSFSYLRKDASYRKLAYGYTHGFTFWPVFATPAGKFEMEVLCYFPMDGATDERADFGCGAHRKHPQESIPCQDKSPPIVTGEAWLAHYNAAAPGDSPRERSCGFRMVSGTPESAAIFRSAIAVIGSLAPAGAFFESQDEAVLQTWSTGLETTIPLESFFYLSGTQGRQDSMRDQADLFVTGGVWRPVIRLTLPASRGGEARFEYLPDDQAIAP